LSRGKAPHLGLLSFSRSGRIHCWGRTNRGGLEFICVGRVLMEKSLCIPLCGRVDCKEVPWSLFISGCTQISSYRHAPFLYDFGTMYLPHMQPIQLIFKSDFSPFVCCYSLCQ
jgi:hypothetical protein